MSETIDVLVRGGRVLTPTGELVDADVACAGGRIVAVARSGSVASDAGAVVDASGLIVAPGLIDAQLNGGWGHDFTSSPESIAAVAAELPATGVTAFVPTIVTAAPERRAAALAAFAAWSSAPGVAEAIGLHFEGPMVSPARVGAHDPDWVGPVADDELDHWTRDAGVVLVTLAPETPGALEAIGRLVAAGVTVSVGHSSCTAAEFADAREAGATMVTHLFNAMSPFGHRAPGPIGATLADPGVVAGLICDGIHVDPVAVAAAWRALGPARVLLVTDAMAALGLPTGAGSTILGRLPVTVGPDGVRTADGVLAGSNLSLDAAVRNLVAFTGCTPAEALGCATRVPADVLGLPDRGRIEAGARADLALLDDELHVQRTIIGGVTAWSA